MYPYLEVRTPSVYLLIILLKISGNIVHTAVYQNHVLADPLDDVEVDVTFIIRII